MPIVREIHLKARPVGGPRTSDFELMEVDLPGVKDGEVRVENCYLTVDPYMRHQMAGTSTYVPPFNVGQVMEGGAIGEVMESKHPDFAVGDYVVSYLGWREGYVTDGKHWGGLRKVDPELAQLSTYLGIMGMPGLTAYAGLLRCAELKEGEIVFVSGAAGAVGNLAGQIAKIKKNCIVIGSAGSDTKVAYLKDCGFDHAFNYKTTDLDVELKKIAPEGLHVYFDNVGGDQLRSALNNLRKYGRIAMCGSISGYNNINPQPCLSDVEVFKITSKELTLRGFISGSHADMRPQQLVDISRWIKEGNIQYRETVFEGIESMPDAFAGLFHGENVGKMIIKLV